MKKFVSKKKATLSAKTNIAPKAVKRAPAAKKTKAYASPSPKKKIETEVEEDVVAITTNLDFLFAHYVQLGKRKFEIYVIPQVVRTFFDAYRIDLVYNEDLKMFVGQVSELPENGPITFIPYENKAIPANIQAKTTEVRDNQADLDSKMEALKEEHAILRQKAIELVLSSGVHTKKGRVYHKKMLTGNWIASVRQLLSDVDMRTPSIADVEDLMVKHPKHKKMLQRLINGSTKHFEVEGVDDENLLQIARTLLKYKTKDIKISFKSSDNVNEEALPTCFSWDAMDIDPDQSETLISDLPFEVKLDLYNLPEIDDANIQFHYKTDQKTDPECPYCGDDFIKHTQKCGTCGLVSGKKKEKK